jgi:hypothetical protein
MFGISGTGKSFAMVRHLANKAQEVVDTHPAGPGAALFPSRAPIWVSWAEMAEKLKRWNCLRWTKDVDNWVEAAKETSWLYLDGLGWGNVVGRDDFALRVLRELIDYRHGNLLPVFWTASLGPFELAEFYKDRLLIRRLVEAWPPVKVKSASLRPDPLAKRAMLAQGEPRETVMVESENLRGSVTPTVKGEPALVEPLHTRLALREAR